MRSQVARTARGRAFRYGVVPEPDDEVVQSESASEDELDETAEFYMGKPGAIAQCPSCALEGRVGHDGRFVCENCGLDGSNGDVGEVGIAGHHGDKTQRPKKDSRSRRRGRR